MSYNKSKCDPTLGHKIHQHLVKCGVETPQAPALMSRTDKIALIENKFRDIMIAMGLDLSDDSLVETPARIGKLFINELYWGLEYDAFPKCTTVINKMGYDEMVIERNISIKSGCEHHFLPVVGVAHVAYIPGKKVLGLSKIPRICEYFSRRPQIQERLTEQIFFALQYVLETDDVAVTINAVHQCVSLRGVEDTSADTTTTKLGGCFKTDPTARAEFFSQIPRDCR